MATQAQRREATRAALLQATIDSLVSDGYAATTTARIAERAGVSRGAAPHYFASKADLVAAALSDLTQRRIAAIREAALAGGAEDVGSIERILDLIWEAHNSLIFATTIDLWGAARSDPALQEALVGAQREIRRAIWRATADVVGPRAQRPEFRADMELVLAVARGLALLPLTGDASPQAANRRWRASRTRLLKILAPREQRM